MVPFITRNSTESYRSYLFASASVAVFGLCDQGLTRRFRVRIDFKDLSGDEASDFFVRKLSKLGYALQSDGEKVMCM